MVVNSVFASYLQSSHAVGVCMRLLMSAIVAAYVHVLLGSNNHLGVLFIYLLRYLGLCIAR